MSGARTEPPLVYLVAGEPSGDVLGAKLMVALKRRCGGQVRFAGVGGERMAAEGLQSLFPIADVAVNGLIEVVPSLRRVFRRIAETAAAVAALRPSVVVTIDAPGFSLRLAQRLRPLNIPLIYYVAPQVWAWRPGRARTLAQKVDHLLTVLPNEAALFSRYGLACTYVGHPAIEDRDLAVDVEGFRTRHAIPPAAKVVVMVPGSRRNVILRMLPVFVGAIDALCRRRAEVFIAVAAVAATEPILRQAAPGWHFPHAIIRTPEDKRDAFAAAVGALAMMGTSTLELAIANTPMIAATRINNLTAVLAWALVRLKFISLPNIILDRAVVPEFIQFDASPPRLAAALEQLIDSDAARAAQRAGFDELRAILAGAGTASDRLTPSERAAAVVVDFIEDGAARLQLSRQASQ